MKVTNKDFLQRLSSKNPDIEPLEEYKGSSENILCRCKVCGNEWSARPGNLLSGKGCKPCAIKRNTARQTKTHETFVAEVAIKNPYIEVLGKYIKSDKKILFRCKKCQYEWPATPDTILQGHGCHVCGGSIKKENTTFLSQLEKINTMITPLEPYVNARHKILCRCHRCKHEWPVTPDKLLRGNGCPNCDKRNKTSFPEQALYYYLKKVYSDATNGYTLSNTRKTLDVFIPTLQIGIEYDGPWHKKKTKEDAAKYQICVEQNIKLYRIREDGLPHINNIADVTYIRHKPFNFDTLDSALKELFGLLGVQVSVNTFEDSASIREQFYTELTSNSLATLYPEVAKEWHAEKNGTITANMVSYGSNDKYWWNCSICQREWPATVADRTVGGKGCPQCANTKRSMKYTKTHDVFVEQLYSVNPNLEPLEKYKRTHDNILIRCKICGNEWPASPANLLRGRDCPKCAHKRRIAKMTATKRENFKKLKTEKTQ